jgi:hypothetical protein
VSFRARWAAGMRGLPGQAEECLPGPGRSWYLRGRLRGCSRSCESGLVCKVGGGGGRAPDLHRLTGRGLGVTDGCGCRGGGAAGSCDG